MAKLMGQNKIINFMKRNRVVSTETMTDEEYIAAIKDEIYNCIADHEVMKKLNVKHLFANNITFDVSKLSCEEMADCAVKLNKMNRVCKYVDEKFTTLAQEHTEGVTMFENHFMSIAGGKNDGFRGYKDAFYSADTIRDLVREAQSKIELESIDLMENYHEEVRRSSLEGTIRANMTIFPVVFDSMLTYITVCARMNHAIMVGFSK